MPGIGVVGGNSDKRDAQNTAGLCRIYTEVCIGLTMTGHNVYYIVNKPVLITVFES